MQSIPTVTDAPRPAEPDSAFAEYRRSRSPESFEVLMRHYVDLVYASALRQLRNADRAQDATQVVFTVLAMKAPKLRPDTVLPAWLLKVTRYTVLDARRRQRRRQRHELMAQQIRNDQQRTSSMNTAVSPASNDVGFDSEGIANQELRAALDEGISRLNHSERAAVVLRYFEGKSHGDIAVALGIREDAARKRVQRGIEKLRTFFAARGAIASTAPVSALASAVGAHARVPAPASLVTHLAANAPSAARGSAAAGASTLNASAKGVLALMAWTKFKIVLTIAALVVLLMGGGAVAVHAITARAHDEIVRIQPNSSPGAPTVLPGVDDSNSDYTLAPGEVLRRIAHPSPSARVRLSPFLRGRNPSSITVEWNGRAELRGQTYGGEGQSLEGMLTSVVGLSSFDFNLPRDFPDRDLPGDWIVRKGATPDQLIPALEAILRQQGRPVHFEKRRVRQDVIVASGSFHFQPIDDPKWNKGVNIYSDKLNEPGRGGGATADLPEFFTELGNMLHRRVVNQAERHRGQFEWRYHDSGDLRYARPGPETENKLDRILANVSRQTGLTFEKTSADENVWFVTSSAGK